MKSGRADCLKFRNRHFCKTFPFQSNLHLPSRFVSISVITRLYPSKIPPHTILLFISSVKMAFPCEKAIFACFDKSSGNLHREEDRLGCSKEKEIGSPALFPCI